MGHRKGLAGGGREASPARGTRALGFEPRTHSREQIKQIADSMREWGWTNPVLVDEDATILAGHGRVAAMMDDAEDDLKSVSNLLSDSRLCFSCIK
ncbi:MAG: ParB N-terminal domain-containing protein [Halofilum sp. (in: g-proteobacteria)]|nr:ParB N-terminal domain-containing protein [Halofilum sp. (in: g-proteobacteria)]